MEAQVASFKVWALDDVVYGPVELEELRGWARDERVSAESWIYCVTTRRWSTALELPGLRELFVCDTEPAAAVRPGVLRRIRVLGDLGDEQLSTFARLGEVVRFPAFTTIMKVGSPGDSMFFVLDGQVRLRILVKEREILIAVQEAGGVFGQISLFDSGPRVTDAVSDSPVMLFKVTAAAFRQLCCTQPEVATPVLLALGRTLATRIRTDDKHLCEMVAMSASVH